MPGIEAGPRPVTRPMMAPVPVGSFSRGRATELVSKPLVKEGISSEIMMLMARAPLQDRFKFGERIETKDSRKLRTALHEISHAKVAQAQGGVVLQVSVTADSSSWGRTVTSGLTTEQFQIVAMASVAGGHTGTGMDEYQATVLSHYGGMAVDSAKSAAHAILSKSDPEIDLRAAHMIAEIGDVDGKTYAQIFERAAIDAYLDGKVDLSVVLDAMNQSDAQQRRYEEHVATYGDVPLDRTEIIEHPNESTTYVRIVGGKRVEELTPCPTCGLPMGQAHSCSQPDKRIEVKKEDALGDSQLLPTRRGRVLVD